MKESAGKVLMLVENHFPSDVRVRNESALLRDEGYDVTVICLKRKGEKSTEVVRESPRGTPDALSATVYEVQGFCRVYRRVCLFHSRLPCHEPLRRVSPWGGRHPRTQPAGHPLSGRDSVQVVRKEIRIRSSRSGS